METPRSAKKTPFWMNLTDCSVTTETCNSSDQVDPRAINVDPRAMKIERKKPIQGGRRETLVEAANQAPSLTRHDNVKVHVSVVFLKIGEIETAKETFTADVFIQARWREPEFDGKINETNLDEVVWKRYWNPMIVIDNNVGEQKESIWHTLFYNSYSQAYIVECRRVKGQFLENLELYEFPFDTQDLTITLSSERCEEEVSLEQDFSEISTINVQSFVDEQEWRLYNNVEIRTDIVTKMFQSSHGKTNFKHPLYSATCHASRRSGYYVWNISVVMFAICSLAFSTFSVDMKLPQNRLQLTFILLLTTVTFKYAVSSSLPRISYLTYLDKYILTCMFTMCIICIWHSIVPIIQSEWADRGFAIGIAFIYAVTQLGFIVFVIFVPLSKRSQFRKKERMHKEKLTSLETEHFHDIRLSVVNST